MAYPCCATVLRNAMIVLGINSIGIGHAAAQSNCEAMPDIAVACDVEISLAGGAGAAHPPIRADVWQRATQLPQPEVSARRNGGETLIIYVPGWGGSRANNRAGLSALVRRGFVIVAIDDIWRDGRMADTGDEAIRKADYDLASDALSQNFIANADRRVGLQADKVRRVIDGLADGYQTKYGQRVRINLDLDRVGILGGSFGGATAAETARRDRRIAAIVNLDGWQFGPAADEIVAAPFLILDSEESRFDPAKFKSPNSWTRNGAILNAREHRRQARQVAARPNDTYRFLLSGAVHSDFTDEVATWHRWRSRFTSFHGPSIGQSRVRTILDEVIGEYFHTVLRNGDRYQFREMCRRIPELRDLGTEETP